MRQPHVSNLANKIAFDRQPAHRTLAAVRRSCPAGAPAPGTSFTDLLRSLDLAPEWNGGDSGGQVQAPEGTTVLALRYSDGVVMVGDTLQTDILGGAAAVRTRD